MRDYAVDKLDPNIFKQRILNNEKQLGVWSSTCSPIVTEIMSYSDFEWILLDGEHAPNDVANLVPQLQSLRGSTVQTVVRPEWNDTVLLKKLLDIGVRNFLIPFIQSADEARAAVAATRYPPEGVRGVALVHRACRFGHVKDYALSENKNICVLLQIENRKGLEALDDICAVDGVDGIFVGPSDLAASLGHTGDTSHEEVQKTIKQIADTCAKHGKTSGTLAFSESDAKRYLDWGFTFVAIGSDVGIIRNGLEATIAPFRG